MKKKWKQPKTLADFDRYTRMALICEVFDALLSIDWMAGDHLDETNVRELAARFDVPFMALNLGVEGAARVTAEDLHEWCRFVERGKAVA